jgi:N-acetylated-alpha-linked acidic dipeptidase
MKNIALILLILLTLAAGLPSKDETQNLTGFSPNSAQRELNLEEQLKTILKPANAENHLRWLTSRPHRTGTEGAHITADYIKQQLDSYGLPAEIQTYTAYLPAPISVSIELVAPARESISTTEDRIEGDEYTEHVAEHPGWDGYSPSGEATGEVVYAGHGSEAELKQIESKGIDLKGKILLMRYFQAGEGTKVNNAEQHGASGVVLYSDPQEDGYRYGDVYPKGDWRPPGAIMRRSILGLPYEGDPLSPGFASVANAKRLNPNDVAFPKIPILPISYRSAERILSLLNGPLAPFNMQGDLPLPYKLGPGPAKLHIKTEMDNRDRPILNVISKIEGEEFPDQWIIVGNHHDAWVFGAGDPSSGTASLLELSRGLGELIRQGLRPKRTIILAFWDAEEMILGGSTEWVEDHNEELLKKAVACINMDSSVFNTERPLSVSAHPLLHRLFRDASRNIKDPKTGKTMFDVWKDMQNEFKDTPSVDGWGDFFHSDQELKEPWIFESPSDDAQPFFSFLALPSSDMYYGADYGMYHSIYENFHWMKTVVDPTFEYHISMALLQGFVSLRLANADLIPLDYAGEANYWRLAYNKLKTEHKSIPSFQKAMSLIDLWETEAKAFQRESDGKLRLRSLSGTRSLELNRKIYLAARDFYRAGGLPGAQLERNLWSGSDGILPGIAGALEKNDSKLLQSETNFYLQALRKRVNSIRTMRGLERQL